ncbi:MAG: AAA family ATPase, partial [Pirellulales bacterium]|nr:AAA family ATPase [Pirellulales bacterium]
MQIQSLEIDGYGVWSGLRIEGFTAGLNVLYGPNEAGKTTLLQFVRSMLYGFTAARQDYFPPVRGGRPGGALNVESSVGRYEIARHLADDGAGQQVILTTPDGMRQGEHLVKAMLSDVDEAVFNNVFAVELREMQELSALGDTEAAAMLYQLTAGLDRVPLVAVLRELAASRNRLLDEAGRPCRWTQLTAEREKCRSEITELSTLSRRFQSLAAERNRLDAELTRLEEERNHAGRQVRLHELARALSPRWRQQQEIDGQLAAIGPVAPMPDDALERLETLNAQGQTHRRRIEELDAERKSLRSEARALNVNEDLRRHAARVEAILEQEPWLTGLHNQLREIEGEIARLEGELTAEADRLGLLPLPPGEGGG